MTQENKELLLKDLSSRLPYGVKCRYQYIQYVENGKMIDINMFGRVNIDGHVKDVCDIKPYLFPLSSMTKEDIYQINDILGEDFEVDEYGISDLIRNRCTSLSYLELDALFSYLNKNHFDYRELIEKGLAIDATGLNIY